ncbi:MAG: hypothetical protein ACO1OB_13110 [Archangium sp.]
MRALAFAVVLVGCGSTTTPPEPQPVSYASDIRPIFVSKCVACHFKDSPIHLNLVDPFDATEGLINRANSWPEAQHLVLVVPGRPEDSALMDKIDPSISIDPKKDGSKMPFTVADVTDAERADIGQWITDGANDDAFYRSNVAPVFGNAANLGRAIGKCSYCHTAISPNSPDVVNAFGARGLVNVNSNFGGKRVLPGSPDDSSLVKKIAAEVPSNLGRKMPLNYEALTAEEIELVRTWILEGALNN